MQPSIYGDPYTNQVSMLDYQSPIGIIEIIGTEESIISILFSDKELPEHAITGETPSVLVDCYHQLDEYFQGIRTKFSFPISYEGTDFQKKVWGALASIPYAKTGSYKDIAESIGHHRAVRAVGTANGRNKLCIVLPCHRIIGTNGTLTGYAGGLWRKEWLLEHERKHHRVI